MSVIILNTSILSAQTFNRFVKEGDKAYSNANYFNASLYYKKALDIDSSSLDLIYKYAETNRLNNDYKLAEHWYHKIYVKDKTNYPLSVFWLAMMKKSNGKYQEAKKLFERYYKSHKRTNDYYVKKANNEIASCDYALKLRLDSQEVAICHLDTTINTVYADFAAQQLDSVLYFTSSRLETHKDEKGNLTNIFSFKIFKSEQENFKWKLAQQLDSIINLNGYDAANLAISKGLKKIYFSRCDKSSSVETPCEIFFSEIKGGIIQSPSKLDNSINLPNYTATQPAIAQINNNEEILFFVSDRPGGYGKLDIWSSIIKNDVYSKPINLGEEINTIDNEITPFYNTDSSFLYFSSDWHKGLGGFDIFKSKRSDTGIWSDPINIGYPINTSYHDLYYTTDAQNLKGYFTSNRPGSLTVQGESCCNDIYSYKWKTNDTSIVIDTIKTISVIKQTLEKKIEVEKEETSKKLLPIILYFENDEPDARSNSINTKKTYEQSYKEYIANLEQYKMGGDGGEIEKFFQNDVTKGFNDLQEFSKTLVKLLEEGKKVKIVLKAYCSPLASSSYNYKLAQRRISSLKNFFIEYQDGALKKYFLEGSTVSFEMKEEALGERFADPQLSDNPNDKKNSVYSRNAATERRIEIVSLSTE